MAARTTFERIQAWQGRLERLLLPPQCQLCNESLDDECGQLQICRDCQRRLSPADHIGCPSCGAFRPPDQEELGCLVCNHLELPFHDTTSIGNYVDALRSTVIEMKRPGHEVLTIQMGKWLGIKLARTADRRIDYIVPVPSHWIRRLKRGTAVTELLIEGITSIYRRPLISDLLISNRLVQKQGLLSTDQRFKNVRNCFDFNRHISVAGKNILLVDDVMTSCATAIQAAARIISDGEAARVDLAIVARGISSR